VSINTGNIEALALSGDRLAGCRDFKTVGTCLIQTPL
jgi:hypothetical protein